MDDLRAVLDDIGSEKAAIVTAMAGGFLACVFAATYPDRVRALVLIDGFARLTRTDDYPWGITEERSRAIIEAFGSTWGTGMMLELFDPDDSDDVALRESWGRYERHSVSPGTAASMVDMINATDIRGILPAIQVPTLVVARTDTPVESAHSRYLAEHIPGATYVELPGRGSLLWAGDQDALLREIEHFVTGSRPAPQHDRVLATVLFTDIVGSTDRAAEIGDARWRELLAEHDQLVRRTLDRFEGREVKTTGDGFLATFDGPARAIRCAEAIHGSPPHDRRRRSSRPAHGRDRPRRRRRRRHRGPPRRARHGRGGRRRDRGVLDGEGPRRGIRDRVRGPRRAPPEGRSRNLAALRRVTFRLRCQRPQENTSRRGGGCGGGGRRRIRTSVGYAGDFTGRSLWPLGHPPASARRG